MSFCLPLFARDIGFGPSKSDRIKGADRGEHILVLASVRSSGKVLFLKPAVSEALQILELKVEE